MKVLSAAPNSPPAQAEKSFEQNRPQITQIFADESLKRVSFESEPAVTQLESQTSVFRRFRRKAATKKENQFGSQESTNTQVAFLCRPKQLFSWLPGFQIQFRCVSAR
jgi:hypothetical protein